MAAWPELYLRGQVPVDGNVLRLFYPNWAFLHAHPPTLLDWPLWNPLRNMGEPFLADPQSLAAYPPIWVLSRLPTYLGFVRLWILGHTLLAAYFMRKWVLHVHRDSVAATVSMIVIAFNGYFVAHGTLLNQFAAAAYVPPVFYFFSRRRTIALGAVLALQWLAGFPPFSYLTVIALAVSGLSMGEARRPFLWVLSKGGVIALGLAAFQLIPFMEFFAHSARPVFLSPSVATEFSEPAGQLIQMVVIPQWPAWSRVVTGDQAVVSFYVGPCVLIAALWALFKGQTRERWLFLATAVCVLLSLGANLPGYAYLPPLHVFRFPSNWLLLSTMGFTLLVAWGITRVTSARWKWTAAAVILLDLLAFDRQGRTPWFTPPFLGDPPPLAQSLRPGAATFRVYHPPSVVRSFTYQNSKAFKDWLLLKDALIPSYGMAFGLREVSSYQVMKLARAARYQERLAIEGPSSPLVRWAGIGHVIVPTAGSRSSELPSVEAVPITGANPPLSFERTSGAQRVTISSYRPGLLEASVATDRADTLIFSEVAYPGWTVSVDGKARTPAIFQETFQSVPVPSGEHTIRFSYSPLTFRTGLGITLGTLVALLLALTSGPTLPASDGEPYAAEVTQISD